MKNTKSLVVIIFLAITIFCTERTEAQETEWGNLFLNIFETGTVLFPHDGSNPIPLSTTTMLEFNPIFTVNNSLMWSIAIGVGTPNTVFNPAPYITTGPVFLLTEKVALAPFLLYQWNPPYSINGGVNSHLLGIGVLLAVPINEYVSFLLPISTAVTLGSGMTGDMSFTIGPGIGLAL